MTRPGYVLAETGVPAVGMCQGGADTVLDLLDSSFTSLGMNDDISPTNRCSRIAGTDAYAHVRPGTYYIQTRLFSSTATIGAYQVRIDTAAEGCGNGIPEPGKECDDGPRNGQPGSNCSAMCRFTGTVVNEVEPNNTRMQANASTAMKGRTVIIRGAIMPVNDQDYFAFDVPAGMTATVVARTHTAMGDPSSCADGVDTKIEIYNSAGAMLAENDDISPSNYCSLIDGTAPEFRAAANLAAGRYFINVHHYNNTRTFPLYFLDISLR
jgi:hypothetical protein